MLKNRRILNGQHIRNMTIFFLILVACLMVQSTSGALAATIQVSPGDSLQAAIDGASSGDTIELESGIYRTADGALDENIFIDKDLTIIGAGMDETFIQAADARDTADHGVFNILTCEVTLQDLTIRYGQKDSYHGGGIIHDTGALTLQNCAVKDNSISGDDVYGGGIFTCNVDVVIKDCVISGNTGTSSDDWSPDGGGMELDYGSLTMSGTTISGNHNNGPGGGMYLYETTANISDSIITGNVAGWDGGGFVSEASTVVLSNCEISGNQSLSPDFGGGGIFTIGTTMEITNCTISGNTAAYESGGIYIFDGLIIISDSTISGNQADDDGGGITNYGFLSISNTTISGNAALDSGGGIYNKNLLRLTDSTISGNSAKDTGGGIKNVDGDLQTSNTTISGNTADYDGGGVFNHDAIATISFTTITDNTAQGVGGGIFNDFYMNLDNSIVAGNSALAVDPNPGDDIYSDSDDTKSNGGNLIGTNNGDQTADLFPAGSPNINNDYVGEEGAVIDPLLEALADNGGSTKTHALSSTSSPAVDHAVGLIFTDQRGENRPYPAYGSCDIGAFEYYGRADLVLTKSVDNAAPLAGDQIIYTVAIKNNGPNQAAEVTVTDSLPDGLTYVSDDSGGDFDSTSGIWTVGSINAGITNYLNLTFQVDSEEEVVNTVTAGSKTTDPTPASASAVINQSGVNFSPVADDQNLATPLNTSLEITLTATDRNGDALTYSIVTPPANGSLDTADLGSGGDTVTYTPSSDIGGTDRFTFKVNDGIVDSNTASVEITIGEVNQFYTLTINKDGNADGTVTASPIGIDCGDVCSDTLAQGTLVRLTATPDTDAAFDGWTGTSCPGNDDCVLTLEAGLTVTATFNPDADGDGISDEVEATGPNGGDANNDNIQDSGQAGVVSFTNIDGDYVYLETQDGITISEVKALTNPSEEDAPDGVEFAYDFFSFKLLGLENGGSTTVALHLPLDESVTTYYKYGPTPDNQNDHWYEFSFDEASGTGAVITHSDETLITLTLTDGQRGDSDLIANAAIYDPGAPASGPTTEASGSGGGGGGGCFCSTLAGDSMNGLSGSRYHHGLLWFVLAGFVMFIGYRRWRKI